MEERLQKALQLLLQSQDQNIVNRSFAAAICDEGQSCRVDLQRRTVNIYDGGEEVGFIKFTIDITGMGVIKAAV